MRRVVQMLEGVVEVSDPPCPSPSYYLRNEPSTKNKALSEVVTHCNSNLTPPKHYDRSPASTMMANGRPEHFLSISTASSFFLSSSSFESEFIYPCTSDSSMIRRSQFEDISFDNILQGIRIFSDLDNQKTYSLIIISHKSICIFQESPHTLQLDLCILDLVFDSIQELGLIYEKVSKPFNHKRNNSLFYRHISLLLLLVSSLPAIKLSILSNIIHCNGVKMLDASDLVFGNVLQHNIRCKLTLGIAKELLYLHCDIRPQNILQYGQTFDNESEPLEGQKVMDPLGYTIMQPSHISPPFSCLVMLHHHSQQENEDSHLHSNHMPSHPISFGHHPLHWFESGRSSTSSLVQNQKSLQCKSHLKSRAALPVDDNMFSMVPFFASSPISNISHSRTPNLVAFVIIENKPKLCQLNFGSFLHKITIIG
ncbi:hypothetical protein G4B88_004689 [Cannabis sativa]|uniref:Protein kinase domain-containing protein n=1 Tax=Cannabis sativa TaxID=3483 RepID=A0A7J6FW74_CANSA|nr:hypothetical protein G4B88_004689 [Cannabis sativa]